MAGNNESKSTTGSRGMDCEFKKLNIKCSDEGMCGRFAKCKDQIDVLLPCPFCGGELTERIYDNTNPKSDPKYAAWEAGASCPECGIGIITGHFGGGIKIESVEVMNRGAINLRPNKQ